MSWTIMDIPPLDGRRAVVTGANAGLGFEIAKVLAQHGADVVLACRSRPKADQAVEEIRRTAPRARLDVGELDLSDLESVARFAGTLSGRLDLLVNNAGLMAVDESRTAQGFETQFGVNHLGHFALTARLLPLLLATPGSRVGSMSSMGHRGARAELNPRLERPYQRWQSYFTSKLANLHFTAELQHRLAAAGATTVAVAAHPGGSHTDLGTEGSSLGNRLGALMAPVVGQPVEAGARPMLRALTDPGVRGGEFFGPRFVVRGAVPVVETPSRAARDAAAARRLWDLSVEMTGLDPQLGRP